MSQEKSLTIADQTEQLEILIEQVKATLVESVFASRMTLVEGKHAVGKAIVDSALYTKWAKGSGDLIKAVAAGLNRSEEDIYLCVLFFKKYNDAFTAVKTLEGKKNDITWAAVRRLLSGEVKAKAHTHVWKKVSAWQCECGKLSLTKE